MFNGSVVSRCSCLIQTHTTWITIQYACYIFNLSGPQSIVSFLASLSLTEPHCIDSEYYTMYLSVFLCSPPSSLSLSSSGNSEVEGLSGGYARCARSFFMNELINSDTALHAFSFLIILISRLYGCPTPPLLHFINTLTCTWQKEQGHRHSGGCSAGHFVVCHLSCSLCPFHRQPSFFSPAPISAKQLLRKSPIITVTMRMSLGRCLH